MQMIMNFVWYNIYFFLERNTFKHSDNLNQYNFRHEAVCLLVFAVFDILLLAMFRYTVDISAFHLTILYQIVAYEIDKRCCV